VTRVRAGFPGLGTLINVVAVVIGALVGMAIGHRLPERTRAVVTDCLGLVTILVAGLSCVSVTDASLAAAVGPGAPVLIVLGSLIIGSIVGSLLRIEERLGASPARSNPGGETDALGRQGTTDEAHAAPGRFIEVATASSSCVGR
jgi:uncharacterized membrane protein YqgA involved in biofilm formation